MLSLTKLLCGEAYLGDEYRYREGAGGQLHGTAPGKGPVVVWNYTRACNLKCRHCYAAAEPVAAELGGADSAAAESVAAEPGEARHLGAGNPFPPELTTSEALRVIDDLAEFSVPVILFSGGEPLCREDFFELANYARSKGIRVTLSTNGTRIDPETAAKIKSAGIGYVGISLDGLRPENDLFRGVPGAFDQALRGIRNCRSVGQRTGLRFTINKNNAHLIPDMFDLIEQEDIDRICFYHLVYSGRGSALRQEDLTHEQTRAALDMIVERTLDLHARGLKKEVLTVDNHVDGIYLYLKYRESDPVRAVFIRQMLLRNGGNRSGMAIACIDPAGNVHPDQFTWQHTFGNVKERSFGEIWTDMSQPLQAGLKDRKQLLPPACKGCTWLSMCNGNFRTRAEAATGDFWGFDPACFLTPAERTLTV